MADLSMLRPGAPPAGAPPAGASPQGAIPQGAPPKAGPPGGMGGGMNMGGLEAVKQIVQLLMRKGMEIEEIIQAMLNMIEMNPEMPEMSEEQIRKVVTQAAGQQGGMPGPETNEAAPGMNMLQ